MFCHVVGMVCWILGIVAIVDYKKWSKTGPNFVFPFYSMYSPHSWLGVFTLAMWGVQVVYGIFLGIFLSKHPEESATTIRYKEVHHFLGYCMYALGLAACITGLQDMQSSDLAMADLNYLMNASYVSPMSMDDQDDLMTGYRPASVWAQLASGGAFLLAALGMSTFATLRFSTIK